MQRSDGWFVYVATHRYWDWKEGRCVRGFKAHETPVLAMEYDRSVPTLQTDAC